MQPFVLEQDGVDLRLVSGDYDGSTGPLKSITPFVSIVGSVQAGKRVQFSATPGYWTLLYIISGAVNVNCETVSMHNLIVFERENDEIIVTAEENTRVLYLSAQPISEPVAAKDNFVMNTSEEIDQAMADYKNGLFGTLDS